VSGRCRANAFSGCRRPENGVHTAPREHRTATVRPEEKARPPCDVPGRGHRAPTRSTPPGGMTPWVCVHRTQRPVYAETDTHGALCTLGSPVPVRS
jgi:hypothetical protein